MIYKNSHKNVLEQSVGGRGEGEGKDEQKQLLLISRVQVSTSPSNLLRICKSLISNLLIMFENATIDPDDTSDRGGSSRCRMSALHALLLRVPASDSPAETSRSSPQDASEWTPKQAISRNGSRITHGNICGITPKARSGTWPSISNES